MLVLAVHGSAAPEGAATIGRLADRLADRLAATTGVRLAVGHLDVQRPSLAEVLARHPGAVVVPLLLGDGYHRKVDVPAVVAAHRCVVTEGLSGERDVTLAVLARLREAEAGVGPGAGRAAACFASADAIVVAGAGSSRPGGNDGTLAVADQLRALRGVPVVPAYCSAAEPTVPEAVARLRAEGHRRIAVATHLLAPGRFTHALADSGAWAVSAPLADHPRIARLVAERYAGAADRVGGVAPAAGFCPSPPLP
jgi:sirohydrochlorin ferrochelatase